MEAPRPFDLFQWLIDHQDKLKTRKFTPKSPPSRSQLPPQPNRTHDAYSQARAYIAKVQPAISGQSGHARTFGVCCALLKGFCLTFSEAKSLLDEWNMTCVPPWSNADLDSKLISAEKSPDLQPKGWMITRKESRFSNMVDPILEEDQPKQQDDRSYNHSGIIDDPASIAIKFMQDNKTDEGLCGYRYWNGQFYRWNGSHYDPVDKTEINSDIFDYIEKEFLRKYIKDCAEVPVGDDVSKVTKKKVTNNLVENVKTGLINLIIISNTNSSEPFWLGSPPYPSWSSDDIIPVKNKLIHLPSFVNKIEQSFIPKTPKYFSTYSLKYPFPYVSYSGSADIPPEWNAFLNSIWPSDQENIDCLQEFFGYFLTPCTRLEKMLMFIGQKRSGKGTIIRVLKHMLGNENVCFPTFKSLTTEFGKQALIGRSLAVFPDARITNRTDTVDVVETILSITGEDDQTINRKYLPQLTTHLTTRFLISSNELPRLIENSGALVNRAIVLKFDKTFLGEEDIELEDKLKAEVPGILRWSIDGWRRIHERKAFFQPASGAQLVAEFLNLSSPISHYVEEHIDIGPTYTSTVRQLYDAWRDWCGNQGRDNPGDMDTFTRNLRSAVPGLDFDRRSSVMLGDRRPTKAVRGLRVKPDTSELTLVTSEPTRNGEANGEANGHYQDVVISF